MAQPNNLKVVSLWSSRVIPFILICVVGYATYVMVALVSVNYLLKDEKRNGAAIAILVIYFILFLLMSLTYARVLYIVNWDPGFVPLGSRAVSRKARPPESEPNRPSSRATAGTISSTRYESTAEPTDPDSPGLENFYTKSVFACETDGKPRWCSECQNWKPERSHHCREVGRCVRKMDHFCPWVGGVVGENSFKFFIQFVGYTALYCTFILIVLSIFIHEVKTTKGKKLNPQWAVILGIACFFGLFTFGMTVNSVRFALTNLSSIEVLGYKTQVKRFAVLLSKSTLDSRNMSHTTFAQVIYPIPIVQNQAGSVSSTIDLNNSALPRHQERDAQAVRHFALVATEPGDNPYDLGTAANWKDVMGESVVDWFLPIRRSPCSRHENDVSEYKLGDAVKRACEKNGIPSPIGSGSEKLSEMRQVDVPAAL